MRVRSVRGAEISRRDGNNEEEQCHILVFEMKNIVDVVLCRKHPSVGVDAKYKPQKIEILTAKTST